MAAGKATARSVWRCGTITPRVSMIRRWMLVGCAAETSASIVILADMPSRLWGARVRSERPGSCGVGMPGVAGDLVDDSVRDGGGVVGEPVVEPAELTGVDRRGHPVRPGRVERSGQ